VRRAALTAALLALAASTHAQSLGEAARREQEKKKPAPASPAPTYTEDDLKSPKRKSAATSVLTATGTRTPSPSPSPEAEPDRARLEREWRARFREARARIAEADARAWEERIEVVYVSGIPVQQKVRVKVETSEVRAAKKALDDLEEELRRSGGLPGWGRE
jgi:hypothetical protein